jgi:hypothetical protein
MHETVRDMHRLGLVDNATMREFDIRCLTPTENIRARPARRSN